MPGASEITLSDYYLPGDTDQAPNIARKRWPEADSKGIRGCASNLYSQIARKELRADCPPKLPYALMGRPVLSAQ